MGNIIKNSIIVIIGLVIIFAVFQFGKLNKGAGSRTELGEGVEVMSSEEVGEKVISFINNNLLRGESKASLVDIIKDKGLYKILFTIEGQDREIDVYASLDGQLFFPDVIDLTEVEEVAVEKETTIGGFSVSDEQICKENGKPVVYFFGSQGCGFCKWEHPIVEKTAQKFGSEISFHNNMDSDDDKEVFSRYSTGGIPTMVFGCRYYKTGAGQANGEQGEEDILTALICDLTGNKPENVCSEVQDLVSQI